MKDGGYKYFIQILSDQSMQYEYRTMAAFVLSMLVDDYPKGQVMFSTVCWEHSLLRLLHAIMTQRRSVFRAMSSHSVSLNWKSPILCSSNGLLYAWGNSGTSTILPGGVVFVTLHRRSCKVCCGMTFLM